MPGNLLTTVLIVLGVLWLVNRSPLSGTLKPLVGG